MNLSGMSGHPVGISDGYRSTETQNRYYEQGRTRPGPVITNARGGQSYHNYGLAIDVYPLTNGRMNFAATSSDYAPIVAVGKAVGFEWGGDWPAPKTDMPHFQMSEGRSTGELRQLQQSGQWSVP